MAVAVVGVQAVEALQVEVVAAGLLVEEAVPFRSVQGAVTRADAHVI